MKYFLLSSLLVFSLISCDRDLGTTQDDVADVEMVFKATYDGAPFIANEVLNYGDDQIRIQTFSFFVSDIRVGTSSSSAEVDDVEYVEFGNINTMQQALDGVSIANTSVPAEEYPGVAMGIGVAADYNAQPPSEYGPYHPLSETSRYWSDWNSYIFLKIEGIMDTDGDGQFDDVSFVYHVGGDDAYRSVDVAFEESIEVVKDNPMQITVTVDLLKILSNDQVTHDIEAQSSLHHAGDPLAGFLMGNFRDAITIE